MSDDYDFSKVTDDIIEMRYEGNGDPWYATYTAQGAVGCSPEDVLDKLMLPRRTPYRILMVEDQRAKHRLRREKVRASLNTVDNLRARDTAWDNT